MYQVIQTHLLEIDKEYVKYDSEGFLCFPHRYKYFIGRKPKSYQFSDAHTK